MWVHVLLDQDMSTHLFMFHLIGKKILHISISRDSMQKQSGQGNTYLRMYFSYMQSTLSFIQGFDCGEAWWFLGLED